MTSGDYAVVPAKAALIRMSDAFISVPMQPRLLMVNSDVDPAQRDVPLD